MKTEEFEEKAVNELLTLSGYINTPENIQLIRESVYFAGMKLFEENPLQWEEKATGYIMRKQMPVR